MSDVACSTSRQAEYADYLNDYDNVLTSRSGQYRAAGRDGSLVIGPPPAGFAYDRTPAAANRQSPSRQTRLLL